MKGIGEGLGPECLYHCLLLFIDLLFCRRLHQHLLLETEARVAQADFKHPVTEDDNKLRILLPPSPKNWDFRHRPLSPFYRVLGIEPRIFCVLN